ncbi:MAG: FTR1 family protein [Mariprofundaceae bacterium]
MISSMVIVFREMLEMALVIGVLLVATRGMPGSRRWIGAGMAIGASVAIALGLFMEELENSFDGDGEFLFNAIVLSIASVLIAWTVIWMSQHGREMTARMKHVGKSVAEGDMPYRALAVVSMAVVMREGAEAVFFLFGAASAGVEAASMLTGSIMGVLLGLILGVIVYRGLLRIPLDYVFSVVGWVLIFLAAGMASQAAFNLVLIDMLPELIESVWNTSSLLSQESAVGELLHVLVGYDENPSGMQLLVFVLFFTVLVGFRRFCYLPNTKTSPVN